MARGAALSQAVRRGRSGRGAIGRAPGKGVCSRARSEVRHHPGIGIDPCDDAGPQVDAHRHPSVAAGAHSAPDPVTRLEDDGREAVGGEVAGGGEASGAGADDEHPPGDSLLLAFRRLLLALLLLLLLPLRLLLLALGGGLRCGLSLSLSRSDAVSGEVEERRRGGSVGSWRKELSAGRLRASRLGTSSMKALTAALMSFCAAWKGSQERNCESPHKRRETSGAPSCAHGDCRRGPGLAVCQVDPELCGELLSDKPLRRRLRFWERTGQHG